MRSASVVAVLVLALTPAALADAAVDPAERSVLTRVARGELDAARLRLQHVRTLAGNDALAPVRLELLGHAIDLAAAAGAPGAELVERGEHLARRVSPRELGLLREAEAALGRGGSYLEPLVRAAYRAIGPELKRVQLLALARDGDARVRARAVSALVEQLAPLRERVLRGGSLTPEEQRRLADPDLVQLLVDRLPDRPARGATDPLPAELAARSPGTATALHGLVLVEAAALPALRAAAAANSPGAARAIAAIEEAVAARLRRFPASSWACARGTPPDCGPDGACPHEGCDATPPPGARFCPACGQQVRQTCALCSRTMPLDAEFCPACGAGAGVGTAAPACPRCRAPSRSPEDRFCGTCGGPVQR